MSHEQAACDRRALRVRLDAEPASVPDARRFVADGLRSWGHDALVDDATLCVSELAGNAALHGGSTYIEVCMLDLERAVRVWVEDDGPGPVTAIAPRTTLPGLDGGSGDAFDHGFEDGLVDSFGDGGPDDLERLLDSPATGRGLAIVSVLASDWGVEEVENGKRVWAVLAPLAPTEAGAATAAATNNHAAEHGVAAEPGPATRPGREPAAEGDGPTAADGLPDGWVVVTLSGCPVGLSLLQDQHLDELVRELTLISAGSDREQAADLGRRLAAILRAPAHARDAGRRQAKAAQTRGEAFVDVEMAMPRVFSQEVRRLHEAVQEADALCEKARLLTLASRPEIRDFREWMTTEIVGQVERDAEPTRWLDWLSERRPRRRGAVRT